MWDFQKYKENIAAVDDSGNQILYRELSEMEIRIKELCNRKIVVALCRNTIGSFAGYAAMINAKAVPLQVPHDMDRILLAELVKAYEPDYIWLPAEKKHEFPNAEEVFERYGYCLLKTKYKAETEIYSELALLLPTSGSTGSPKYVRQSYRNILANTESIVQYLNLDSTERSITTLPMNYTYGLSIINTHLYVGAKVLLTDRTLMQKGFWEFFAQEKATSFGGVPYTYEMLDKLRFFQMDLPSLRYMTQAGGKLDPELHKKFAEYARESGRKFIVMYGQTEATARMAYLPAEKAIEKCGSMGIAIPGGRFELIDSEENVIKETDVVGELVYEGANVTLGYARRRKDLGKGDELEGRLVTGDMAKRDTDGFFYLVGRRKRFLKMFGKRINLDEIERLIKERFKDIDCAVVGTDDNMYLFVTNEAVQKDARSYIAETVHIHISAVKSAFIRSIPRNDSGKVIYAELIKYCK